MTNEDANPTTEQPVLEQTPAGKREHQILEYWESHNIFEQTLTKDAPHGNFVFYDGPPYATGLPHYGHILPTTLKDVIPRYKTMRGFRVPRRWGWDCHGLPIENLIEKELGLQNKKQIEELGIDVFNKAARESVLRYADEWKRIIPRLGRWVDMENDYRSMDSSFMESVMWSFKELHTKGLVYEGYKVMPYCPRCQTVLSNAETNQPGAYRDITDLSAYAKFELVDEPGTFFVAWTTTPWTLPGNVALAVNPDITYVKAAVTKEDGSKETYIVAKDRLEVIKEAHEVIAELTGAQLAGHSYKPPFEYYTAPNTLQGDNEMKRPQAWKVYNADFVTATDGTGIVHIAPAFGEDDMNLARAVNLPVIHHVLPDGTIKSEVTVFAGMTAKPKGDHQKTDIEVIKQLAARKALFSKEKYIHSYPHCWRCDTPLLNFATSSWFVKVTAMKDQLIAENNKVNWVPKEIGEGRFGKWLEGARDWAMSRSRYWGAPLPVWRGEQTGAIELIGSIAELKEKIVSNGNNFVLMRHGESESNVKDIINSIDLNKFSLTEKGVGEVQKSAEELKEKGVTIIYASDFKRTKQTAELVAETIGFDKTKIIYDERLREVNAGEFEGGTWTERFAYFKNNEERMTKRTPNGESVADVKKRVAEFLYEIDAKHKNEDILIITHGLPLRLAKLIAEGKTIRDMIRGHWQDTSDATASLHAIDFKQLPKNEEYELDLHRPYIDDVTWVNAEGDVMRRIPEVFDVWYDSGSMSFASQHYPFEKKDTLLADGSSAFPADFIAEGLDQTRGWFYLMLVMCVGLFNKAPYRNVVVNGLILAEDGRKMSKSLKNYPDLMPTVEKYGADSLRYYLMASPAVHGEEVLFSEKGLDEVNKKLFNRLGNVHTFYETYAGEYAGTFERPQSTNMLDTWILARLDETVNATTAAFEKYEIDRAARPLMDLVDDLSTWYLRRSRDRYKGDDVADKKQAIDTTAYVLYVLSLIMAPFTPFFAEDLYLKLTRGTKKESVHLERWPITVETDTEVLEKMTAVRKIVEAALADRAKHSLKVRQPLASVTVQNADVTFETFPQAIDLIKDEVNVKAVQWQTVATDVKNVVTVDQQLTPELIEEGTLRELMRAIQDIRKKIGLSPTDSISMTIAGDEATEALIKKYQTELSKAVLATSVSFGANEGEEIAIDAMRLRVHVARA